MAGDHVWRPCCNTTAMQQTIVRGHFRRQRWTTAEHHITQLHRTTYLVRSTLGSSTATLYRYITAILKNTTVFISHMNEWVIVSELSHFVASTMYMLYHIIGVCGAITLHYCDIWKLSSTATHELTGSMFSGNAATLMRSNTLMAEQHVWWLGA